MQQPRLFRLLKSILYSEPFHTILTEHFDFSLVSVFVRGILRTFLEQQTRACLILRTLIRVKYYTKPCTNFPYQI